MSDGKGADWKSGCECSKAGMRRLRSDSVCWRVRWIGSFALDKFFQSRNHLGYCHLQCVILSGLVRALNRCSSVCIVWEFRGFKAFSFSLLKWVLLVYSLFYITLFVASGS